MLDPINFNGQIIDGDTIGFNQLKRGFNFGDGLFETIRVFNGKIICLDAHFNRISSGLDVLKIKQNYSFNQNSLERYINELLLYKNIKYGGKVKVYIFRAGLGTYKPETNQMSFVVEAMDLEQNKYVLNKKGFLVDIYSEYSKTVNQLSFFKTSNSLLYVLAAVTASENNLDDLFIVNQKSEIIESSNSNVFFLKEDVLLTPPLNSGCIEGVMRIEVIRAAKDLGINVLESNVYEEDLEKSREIFLTNVISGIRWVGGYKKKRFYNFISKKIIEKLNKNLANYQ
ncbi:aminotransferase class IV [Flavobacteriales bacterium]|nr:aminotransferase class IV [Flavobacteriales bacterium]